MATALILGCAECVWDDALAALRLFTPDAIIATKDMMVLWPGRIDIGVTLHPDRTVGYMRERKKLGRAVDFPVYAHRNMGTAFLHKVTTDWQGSTGLLAVKVAIEEKIDAIVLAGIPVDNEGGHIVRRRKWTSAQVFRRGWKLHLNEIQPHTRSMSGWTKDLLGEPTIDWLISKGASAPDQKLTQLIEKETTKV